MKIINKQIHKICCKLKEEMVGFDFLAKGNHNENYIIRTTKNKYVLRIENNVQFNNLRKEYQLLKSLKPGLGPKVYFFDKTLKIIPFSYFIEEFIEGEQPKRITKDFLMSIAKWLHRLHMQKKQGKKIYLLKAIKPYLRNVEKYKYALPIKTQEEISDLIPKVKKFCVKNDNIFANRNRFSLLHGDLSLGNIIYNNKKVRLLDWEFSNYNFPEWDLIYLISELGLTKKQEELFLASYGYPTSKKNHLSIFLLLKFCGDIGYSTWRLSLIKEDKLDKKFKIKTIKRLNKDIKKLNEILKQLND